MKFKIFLILSLAYILYISNYTVYAVAYDKEELKQVVENIYNKRCNALISGDTVGLKDYFDISQKYGQWALEHETKRAKYLKQWATQREIRFSNIESTVRIKRIYPKKSSVRIALEESYRFDYIYPRDEDPTKNSFGIGIRHTLDLTKKGDKYLIYTDWYTDCFEDALSGFSGTVENSSPNFVSRDTVSVNQVQHYNREKAVAYADKYCGAAWGSGNDFKYNKKYRDYTGIGGDCTNFASQVLGDKEGGGLRADGSWLFNGSGSRAWVNADGLKDYLLYSGKGSLIKIGNFKDLTSATAEYENGIISRLDVGDLVCYAKKTDIDHFAVVTGFDRHGYPLVNSHTTDRYHVPWDLGWGDIKIKFYLIHIRD